MEGVNERAGEESNGDELSEKDGQGEETRDIVMVKDGVYFSSSNLPESEFGFN